ncbi:MAG TPA: TRAP transporter small permease subunit [Casimicrobiaceae bacterium]|nr:TRAP transporter small permease subunit [Casimicrobiaceae bacterium]
MTLARWRGAYERFLEAIVIVLMSAMAIEVTIGICYRAFGHALSWYDEVAVILLAWLTFYGSALAALKRAHIGFPGLVRSMPASRRLVAVIVGKLLVLAFLALLGWVGYQVLGVLATDYLISLPEIPVAWAQSVIPISCFLFIVAELLNLPDTLRAARGTASVGASDLAEGLH